MNEFNDDFWWARAHMYHLTTVEILSSSDFICSCHVKHMKLVLTLAYVAIVQHGSPLLIVVIKLVTETCSKPSANHFRFIHDFLLDHTSSLGGFCPQKPNSKGDGSTRPPFVSTSPFLHQI